MFFADMALGTWNEFAERSPASFFASGVSAGKNASPCKGYIQRG